MVCQYACTTEGFFEPTETFSYISPPKCHPFSVVHPLPGFVAVYRPESSLSLPLSFSVEGVDTTLFMAPFQLPVVCNPLKSDSKVRPQSPTRKSKPRSPNSESDHNSDRTSDGPDRTVRAAPTNGNTTRWTDRDNNRSSG